MTWNQAAFDRAQWVYDNATPPEAPIFRCEVSGEMNEDCEECPNGCEMPEYGEEEPADFDEWRLDKDAWMDDPRDDYDF